MAEGNKVTCIPFVNAQGAKPKGKDYKLVKDYEVEKFPTF